MHNFFNLSRLIHFFHVLIRIFCTDLVISGVKHFLKAESEKDKENWMCQLKQVASIEVRSGCLVTWMVEVVGCLLGLVSLFLVFVHPPIMHNYNHPLYQNCAHYIQHQCNAKCNTPQFPTMPHYTKPRQLTPNQITPPNFITSHRTTSNYSTIHHTRLTTPHLTT